MRGHRLRGVACTALAARRQRLQSSWPAPKSTSGVMRAAARRFAAIQAVGARQRASCAPQRAAHSTVQQTVSQWRSTARPERAHLRADRRIASRTPEVSCERAGGCASR